jgi:hypothetical protein
LDGIYQIQHVLRGHLIFPGSTSWEIQMLRTERNLIYLTKLDIGDLLTREKNYSNQDKTYPSEIARMNSD